MPKTKRKPRRPDKRPPRRSTAHRARSTATAMPDRVRIVQPLIDLPTVRVGQKLPVVEWVEGKWGVRRPVIVDPDPDGDRERVFLDVDDYVEVEK